MNYFCSCKKCKANSIDRLGCYLKTKKTFKKHQKKDNSNYELNSDDEKLDSIDTEDTGDTENTEDTEDTEDSRDSREGSINNSNQQILNVQFRR